VLNIVTGTGDAAGRAIVAHPGIRKVSFTGSSATAPGVREAAAPFLKEVTLELGGSDPMIVWRDAPLAAAVEGAVRGRFYNAGQVCNAVKRIYVHEEIAARLPKNSAPGSPRCGWETASHRRWIWGRSRTLTS